MVKQRVEGVKMNRKSMFWVVDFTISDIAYKCVYK